MYALSFYLFRNRLIRNAVPTMVSTDSTGLKSTSPKRKRPAPKPRTIPSPKKVTPVHVDVCKPTPEVDYYAKYLMQKSKNQTLRTKLCRLKKKLFIVDKKQTKKQRLQEAIDSVSRVLTGGAKSFFESQVYMSNRSEKGRRYTHQDKAFALTVYRTSPKCYRLLQNTFALPSVSILRKTMRKINIVPGVHDAVFDDLELKSIHATD